MSLKPKWPWIALATGAAAVLLRSVYLEQYFFEVKRFRIGKEESRDRVRLLLLSDLHFGHHFMAYHAKLARTVNRIHPDLVLVSGDLIDQWGEAPPLNTFLNRLDPSVPKLAIMGNHDHKNGVSKGTLKKLLEKTNGQLLANETVEVQVRNHRITITGLDDFIESEGCFHDAIKGVGKADHHFLLLHSPLQQEGVLRDLQQVNSQRSNAQQLNIQYIFAGHNHGGQVRLGPIVPKLPEKAGAYLDGWYNDQKPFLYLSKGFGTSCLPFRFGARPEITVFDYGA